MMVFIRIDIIWKKIQTVYVNMDTVTILRNLVSGKKKETFTNCAEIS